jgi:response regulator RpfG family c-di-GMP phosphodiesterase/serine/threonine protein kinase
VLSPLPRSPQPGTNPWSLLDRLVQFGLIEPSDREIFISERIDRLREYVGDERLGQALVQDGLLTSYQLERVLGSETHGLVLGNYRVLEELGRGGMGIVYLAEHRLLKRRVAIKVVPVDEECHPIIRQRFQAEMRILADLSHPNIVLAHDAGELPGQGPLPSLVYLVMELIQGNDLDRLVRRQGPCSIAQGCSCIRQAAAGLQAAHDRHLIHRDIKPSNLLLADATGQVKLVDFGLVRQFVSRLTDPRALLGSVEFMPPEQSHDPSTVGREADIYGLGATMFWVLTGEGPYPATANLSDALRQLQERPPRRLREVRPDVPLALDDLVAQMLERCPTGRPASALAVMNALRPFVLSGSGPRPVLRISEASSQETAVQVAPDSVPRLWQNEEPRALLVVEDEVRRQEHRTMLLSLGCFCREARDWREGILLAEHCNFDLAVLDGVAMTDQEAVRRLRTPRNPHLPVLFADDSVDRDQLMAQVRQALAPKVTQDWSRLADQVLHLNQQLQACFEARRTDLRKAHNALLFTLSKVAESLDGETSGHLKRMQRYTRTLAAEALKERPWQGLVTEPFLTQLHRCVPLHDIGKIGVPNDILVKPASLTRAERKEVETHVLIGDQILESLGREHGSALDFLGLARSIVRHHHERFDGQGYPDHLIGEAIPPAARLVSVADVYDALRRMRLYKPALSHQAAIRTILDRSQGQFDPALLRALSRCHAEFERIYREIEE